ncbi:MAG: D-alanine--D-alanine ligase [Phycisphaeraceae bacterium]
MTQPSLKVLVLAGGPDRERDVSLQSGETIARSLKEAGHEVLLRDILPDDLAALEEFTAWGGDVIFPALHGGWGEGGGLQTILDQRGVPYVGCRTEAASLCMDKYRTKAALFDAELPTLPFELIGKGDKLSIEVPFVLKAPREGSSIDLIICKDDAKAQAALADLFTRHEKLMVEKFCKGMEITVGVLEDEGDRGQESGDRRQDPGLRTVAIHALPPIRIIPATEHYDYEAKYTRNDTQYHLDPEKIGLASAELEGLGILAVEAFRTLGCRHLSRIDFILDDQKRPWILEVNTLPGFTSHSLLPMAAAHSGLPLPKLVDRLVRLALAD